VASSLTCPSANFICPWARAASSSFNSGSIARSSPRHRRAYERDPATTTRVSNTVDPRSRRASTTRALEGSELQRLIE
jgi:hypothetical protein